MSGAIILVNADGTQQAMRGEGGLILLPHQAGERIPGNRWASYLVSHQEWLTKTLNPRAASTGTTKGPARTAGNIEIQIGIAGPIFIGRVVTENDTVEGEILLRDVAAVGASGSARALATTLNTVTIYELNWFFQNGCTMVGSLDGVSATISYKQAT